MKWWLWLLIAVALITAGTGFAVMLIRAPKGKRLTRFPAGPDGNVSRDPYDLARDASAVLGYPADPETYALARMLVTEGGDKDSGTARVLRAWVAYNDARKLGMTFVQLFTFSNNPSHAGLFGSQTGRRYGTSFDPYEGDYKDAALLRESFKTGSDPTGGADKFTDQNRVPSEWLADGYVRIPREDARPGFSLFRKKPKGGLVA